MALPLNFKNNIDVSNLYDKYTCKVCVNYILYDKKKKTILKHSSSRPCGVNYHKRSLHAEQRAIYELNNYKSKNNIDIFIWRFFWGNAIFENFPKSEISIFAAAQKNVHGKY